MFAVWAADHSRAVSNRQGQRQLRLPTSAPATSPSALRAAIDIDAPSANELLFIFCFAVVTEKMTRRSASLHRDSIVVACAAFAQLSLFQADTV